MLNNKGFAISSVLYLLLVAFLMFLMLMLAQFTSSTSIIGKANDDLINGTYFEASQIKDSNKQCIKSGTSKQANDIYWYESGNGELLVRIKSRYGTMYWPKDFGLKINPSNGNIEGTYHSYKNIDVYCLDGSNCEGKNLFNVTYVDKKLDLNLTSSSSTSNMYNGGRVSINNDDVDKFKDIFNKINSIENPNLSCSTKTYKNFEDCKKLFDERGLSKSINSNGEIKLLFSSEWRVYRWDLEEPISFTYKNDETNETASGKISQIFYTYIVLAEENPAMKNLIGNSTNNLDFYFDSDKLFTYSRDKLQPSINNLDTISTVTAEQKLKITDIKSGSNIDDFGLYDICE